MPLASGAVKRGIVFGLSDLCVSVQKLKSYSSEICATWKEGLFVVVPTRNSLDFVFV